MSLISWQLRWFWVASLLSSLFLPSAAAQTKATLPPVYQNWLNQDVRYLISDQERSEFKSLTTDVQRDAFVAAFWERRNPDAGSAANTFKEEHYRRLAYVNSHFADRLPGYRTDRGRIYIMYGPPDDVQRHSSTVGFEALSENGKAITIFASELWHYSFIPGIGEEVDFRFVDTCGCGVYRIPVDDSDLKKYSPK